MKYDVDRGFLRQIFVITGVETSGALSVYFSSHSKSHVRMLGASYVITILFTVSLYGWRYLVLLKLVSLEFRKKCGKKLVCLRKTARVNFFYPFTRPEKLCRFPFFPFLYPYKCFCYKILSCKSDNRTSLLYSSTGYGRYIL